MKIILSISTFILTLIGCNFGPETPQQMMEEVRKNAAEQIEISNAKTFAWEKLVDSIYKIADTNHASAIRKIDNLINYDNSIDRFKIEELHFIKGQIYYRIDSLQNAITEFSFEGQLAPRTLVARAGAYIKLKQFTNAFSDLTNAANVNYGYDWNVGNYYEIIGKKDSAIFFYSRLYLKDSLTYKSCKDRILELNNPDTKPLTELIIRERKPLQIRMEVPK